MNTHTAYVHVHVCVCGLLLLFAYLFVFAVNKGIYRIISKCVILPSCCIKDLCAMMSFCIVAVIEGVHMAVVCCVVVVFCSSCE